ARGPAAAGPFVVLITVRDWGPSRSLRVGGSDPLATFNPATRAWFEATFQSPTRAQELAWPAIALGESVLVLAPTGSGKTLAAFLAAIDHLMFSPAPKKPATRIAYISPLKA